MKFKTLSLSFGNGPSQKCIKSYAWHTKRSNCTYLNFFSVSSSFSPYINVKALTEAFPISAWFAQTSLIVSENSSDFLTEKTGLPFSERS